MIKKKKINCKEKDCEQTFSSLKIIQNFDFKSTIKFLVY